MDPKFSKLNRIEDKYVVSRDDAMKIQKEVEKHLDPFFVEPGVKFEFISSTYLDSDRLTFYRKHLDFSYPRVKMRIRQYGPDGVWNPKDVFLELKEKSEDGECTKTRIQLDPTNLKNVREGKKLEMTSELKSLNKKEAQRFHVFFKRANDYITRLKLKPVVTIMYKRYAYQKGKVRVTIDFNIIYNSMNSLNLMKVFKLIHSIDWGVAKKYGKKYDTTKDAVVEIKYQDANDESEAPEWIEDMIEEYKMEPTAFSKYAWALYNLMLKVLG